MPLQPGTTLGPYQVTAKIGEGGMGEVYQARDTKLDRDVALKVLPEAFTSDPDRLARFEREAKVLASLNHPNIGSIYGLEEAEGVKALVLELIEGPTLADRIKQGPIPIDEALPIAKQIAEALEAAHEQGVIHRDLKPANVKVKDDGTVKVLDFGLAKAFQAEPGSDPSESPTMTAAATRAGVILGTAAYMSPEQAKGKPADRRADIWAFGCVLYEMLTGVRPFGGGNVSEVLAEVIKSEPDWEALPDATPTHIRLVERQCLQKDPRLRLHDVADLRLAMDGAFNTLTSQIAPVLAAWQRPVPVVAAVLAAIFVGGLAVWSVTRQLATASPNIVRSVINTPPGGALAVPTIGPTVALSPDGSLIVYVSDADESTTRLFVRQMGQLGATPIPGTDGAQMPVFSPDGEWVVFREGLSAETTLKKVPIGGGTPVTIVEQPGLPRGISWGPADGASGSPERTLVWVDHEGLEEPLLAPPRAYYHPRVSPDGSKVVVAIDDGGDVDLHVYDLERGQLTKVTFDPAPDELPVWTSDGRAIMFASDGTVFRRSADGSGDAERLTSGVNHNPQPVSLSSDGTRLFFLERPEGPNLHDIFTLGLDLPDARPEAVLEGAANYRAAELSPDGRWLAYTSNESGGQRVYVGSFPTLNDVKLEVSGDEAAYPPQPPPSASLQVHHLSLRVVPSP